MTVLGIFKLGLVDEMETSVFEPPVELRHAYVLGPLLAVVVQSYSLGEVCGVERALVLWRLLCLDLVVSRALLTSGRTRSCGPLPLGPLLVVSLTECEGLIVAYARLRVLLLWLLLSSVCAGSVDSSHWLIGLLGDELLPLAALRRLARPCSLLFRGRS